MYTMYASLASLWWSLLILSDKVSGIEKRFFHIVGRPCQMANALLLQMHSKQLLYTQPHHIRTNCSNKHNGRSRRYGIDHFIRNASTTIN